jgi:YHS domain-containing protein
MFRALLYTILGIFVLAAIRMIMTTLSRGVADLFREEAAASPKQSAANRPPATSGGSALKRDPVCGTYIPADTSVHKLVAGELIYFCSPECRDKYTT